MNNLKCEIKALLDSFSDVMKLIHQKSYHKHDNLSIYPGQPKLIMLIREHDGISQKDLAAKNHVKPATITGMLNKLEAQNYIYRQPDDKDKRIMRVYLTKEGIELAQHCDYHMNLMIESFFKNFSKDELQTFTALMNKIKHNLLE